MAHGNDINSLLSELQTLDDSHDPSIIGDKLNRQFHSKTIDILRKWISNDRLSNEEKHYINLYSKLQLSFVEYHFFKPQPTNDNRDMVDVFLKFIFQRNQIDELEQAVSFVFDRRASKDNKIEEDEMLTYLMRMLDARSFGYRLCFEDLQPRPTGLNNALKTCIFNRHAKDYFYDIISSDNKKKKIHISNLRLFFMGCSTFAVALYDDNKTIFENDNNNNKYICILAKSVRIMLNTEHFEDKEPLLYCLRGVLALLTNCIPTEPWLRIINNALANSNDENAQQANPFNEDLFASIIIRLLGSQTLQKKALKSSSNISTSLIDVALIFLNKWCDMAKDFNDDDDENNNESSLEYQDNQVLHLLRSNTFFDKNSRISSIFIPYINADFDRIRLMAVSALSRIMSNEDFSRLDKERPNMAQDIVNLIFTFIDRAAASERSQYKGISFELLLRYLLRFLVQDLIKEQTIKYLPKIVEFAEQRHINALKILRKISSSAKMIPHLLKSQELTEFLRNTADALFDNDRKMKNIVEEIRQNLIPTEQKESSTPSDTNSWQAFISYCHHDKKQRIELVKTLEKAQIFTNIWIDEKHMIDNMVDTITRAICESKVVFVLLSDAYCASDTCRREWEFAVEKRIKVYPVFVQEGFKRTNYDWVAFLISQNFYVKIHKSDEVQRLINRLKEHKRNERQLLPAKQDDLSESKKLSFDLTKNNELGNQESPTKKPIVKWTSTDIEHWCHLNKLEKWCTPLANYDGKTLLELRRILEIDANLSHVADGYGISLTDAVLFKCKLNELVSQTNARIKTAKRKDIAKRQSSDASAK